MKKIILFCFCFVLAGCSETENTKRVKYENVIKVLSHLPGQYSVMYIDGVYLKHSPAFWGVIKLDAVANPWAEGDISSSIGLNNFTIHLNPKDINIITGGRFRYGKFAEGQTNVIQ